MLIADRAVTQFHADISNGMPDARGHLGDIELNRSKEGEVKCSKALPCIRSRSDKFLRASLELD